MATLAQLVSEIKTAYKKSYDIAYEFLHLDEVSSFILRRQNDLNEFQRITARYNREMDILDVQQELKARGFESKFYGGICLQKADYFAFTKKVQKAIKADIEENSFVEDTKPIVNYNNPDYAIFDELSSEELQELTES